MGSEVLIYICFSVILVVMFVYLNLKDKEARKKFSKFEIVLEELIKENYQLKKQISSLPKTQVNDDSGIIKVALEHVDEALNLKVAPMLESLKSIEKVIDDFQNDQQNRLYSLEERTKTFTKITPPSFDSEEDRIIELYNAGKSVESIARDLRLSVGRINMVLKFHKVI
ncbi:hypothetical protein [Campylobacter hyointestinalis]|uniref:hypothetical protein n=1 Tax=Campylobacter hyointestinalis TaxID=198 RepID=UPI000CE2F2D6|nr:hypothetical protein [Campylobacter hyointestinalis]PPB66468.1 hypothetical protein CDQ76_08775 [Campylobacter hyointestinalis subsp. hyointestinalis]